MTFRCGHPREPGNSAGTGNGYTQCALCKRVKDIARKVGRDQRRINAGSLYTLGERIARGIT